MRFLDYLFKKVLTGYFDKYFINFKLFYISFKIKKLFLNFKRYIFLEKCISVYTLFKVPKKISMLNKNLTYCTFNTEKKINYLFVLSHYKGVSCFSVQSRTPTSIITGGLDGFVKFWKGIHKVKTFCTLSISNKPIRSIIQLPKHRLVLVNHCGKNIIAFDLENLKIVRTFQIGKFFTVMKKNACNNNSFLTGCSDGSIYDWDILSGNLIQKYEGHIGPVNSIISDHLYNILVSTGKDKKIRVWNYGIPYQSGQISRSFASRIVSSIYIHKLSICVYQTSLNKIFTTTLNTRYTMTMGGIFLGHKIHGIYCKPSYFSKDQLLTSGDYYGSLHFWHLIKKNKISNPFKCHHGALVQIKFISNTNKFITASWDGFIKYWLNSKN